MALWGVPGIEATSGRGASQSCTEFLQMRVLGKASGLARAVALAG